MSSNQMDALFNEAQKVTATDKQVSSIALLIEQEQQAEADIRTAEALLENAKGRKRDLLLSKLPEAMLGAGMREFTTAGGLKAKVVFLTDGSLGSARTEEEFAAREAKIDCIIENGGGEIVKQTVTIEFPKEFAAEADVVKARLEALFQTKKWGKIPVKIGRERTVNHMTFSSWIKERMASGEAELQLPPSFFEQVGIWYGEGVKIQQPRKPKEKAA